VRVVVSKADPGDRRPEAAVVRLGGTVDAPLPIVDGFSATVPTGAVARLAATAGVTGLTLDRPVTVSGAYGEGSGVASAVYTDAVRAKATWEEGHTGARVGVAVIDTGVNATGDLAGKVVTGPDFTSERDGVDRYGHGTFVAGLIAGQGTASGGAVKGVAPGAHIVSVKIAGADGRTDIVRLLAALEWVVAVRDVYNIRVLNLALGTDSTQSYLDDPLNFAVERVWNAGIVVVAAAGNGGNGPGTITKPADDPLVVTAGAADDHTTAEVGDDTVATFSAAGPTAADGLAKPDLVAPGKSVVSLRVPGSTVDAANPAGRVGNAYFRGSGSSFSAAVTSGSAALVLSRTPTLTPNQVKARLVAAARPAGLSPAAAAGAGEVDAYAATMSTSTASANQGVVPGTGGGSLQASRGSACMRTSNTCLPDAIANAVTGFDPSRYFGSQWAGSSWLGSSWLGSSWLGSSWLGSSWLGSSWLGSSWLGSSWLGSSWLGSSWLGSSWLGSSWLGSSWLGSSWLGSSWLGSSWMGSSWLTADWQ
ncbi:MAG: S8 family serine peptidase, partial [Acidimicrobiia bacterium]